MPNDKGEKLFTVIFRIVNIIWRYDLNDQVKVIYDGNDIKFS